MAITRRKEDGFDLIDITPDEAHQWLERLVIGIADDDISLTLWFKKPETGEEVQKHNDVVLALKRSRDFFERIGNSTEQKQIERAIFDNNEARQEARGGYTEMIELDAGPTSKIRSILNESGLSIPIQTEVMQELERIWREKAR